MYIHTHNMLAKTSRHKNVALSFRCPPHACGNSPNLNIHDSLLSAVRDHKWWNAKFWRLEERVARSSLCALAVASNVTLHLLHHTAFSKQFEPEVKGNKYLVTGTGKLLCCSASWSGVTGRQRMSRLFFLTWQRWRREANTGEGVGSLCMSLFLIPSLSLSHSQSHTNTRTHTHTHTLPPSLSPHPIPIVCLIRGSFVAGFHTRTPASVAAFFSQGLPCSSVTPSLFNLHGNASVCLCVCVLWACPPAVCASEHMHTHTHIHIWVNRHAIPSEPGNARDYGKRCDYYQDFFFVLFFPPTSFVFDKRSIDPSLPGVLCMLTVKKQAAQTHNYCGYFWKTSMHLIFHLLKNSACWRPPPLSLPHNSNLLFSQSHTMLFCGMWRPQHTSKVLMLPSVWILKRCPLTHSLTRHSARKKPRHMWIR